MTTSTPKWHLPQATSDTQFSAEHLLGLHAHVYFEAATEAVAEALREKTIAKYAGRDVEVYGMIRTPAGPHPVGMFKIEFSREMFADVVLWLERERGDLSVLVHVLSGDEYYDHTQGALWLGPQQSLRLSFLKKRSE
ncbi:hypothetical protein BV898_10867 [Hypsibius exemplaris]|uniref:DOPA 4,5-dioxygenase n=1 Tax=Hypsibius exemplaris TaxID=2072580 RepID=A0A1W0WIL7_HYPEX|nr:hypothetical protein BV898_10867 [Hypsibius exemplaris]